MAISINGIPVAGNGKNGKDATINGVNALTLKATGGLTGQQSGEVYNIDGSGLFSKSGGELNGDITFLGSTHNIYSESKKVSITLNNEFNYLSLQSQSKNSSSSFGLRDNDLSFSVNSDSILSGIRIYEGTVLLSGSVVAISKDGHSEELVATQKYVDDLVGNINTLLDTINGEVV